MNILLIVITNMLAGALLLVALHRNGMRTQRGRKIAIRGVLSMTALAVLFSLIGPREISGVSGMLVEVLPLVMGPYLVIAAVSLLTAFQLVRALVRRPVAAAAAEGTPEVEADLKRAA